jgi:hypothetical protein
VPRGVGPRRRKTGYARVALPHAAQVVAAGAACHRPTARGNWRHRRPGRGRQESRHGADAAARLAKARQPDEQALLEQRRQRVIEIAETSETPQVLGNFRVVRRKEEEVWHQAHTAPDFVMNLSHRDQPLAVRFLTVANAAHYRGRCRQRVRIPDQPKIQAAFMTAKNKKRNYDFS